jgi:glycosyltransferase involved in cell wall biosynthesis
MRMRVLCFVDYYLPGYKGGGAIRTIVNMVDHLGDEIEFLIVTRDRDLKSTEPYSSVLVDEWSHAGKARIFYASPATLSPKGLTRLLRNTPHDILYLNSFFSPCATGIPLLIRRLGFYGRQPVILAPRGEFSPGALALKSTKKSAYIRFVNVFGLYRKVVWQASSEYEADDIRRALGGFVKNVYIAPDLLPRLTQDVELSEVFQSGMRATGPLRVVFLSRISPVKNLDYLLGILLKVKISLQLTIYGPTEDTDYWAKCQNIIQALPSHILVTYAGEVIPTDVSKTFANHDLFVFPTRGENFGHVIFESLAVGTSVLVSDQTPWQSDPHGAVEILPLHQPEAWVVAIERWAGFNDSDHVKQRVAAVNYSRRYMDNSQATELNRRMFRNVFTNVKKKDKCLGLDL